MSDVLGLSSSSSTSSLLPHPLTPAAPLLSPAAAVVVDMEGKIEKLKGEVQEQEQNIREEEKKEKEAKDELKRIEDEIKEEKKKPDGDRDEELLDDLKMKKKRADDALRSISSTLTSLRSYYQHLLSTLSTRSSDNVPITPPRPSSSANIKPQSPVRIVPTDDPICSYWKSLRELEWKDSDGFIELPQNVHWGGNNQEWITAVHSAVIP